MSRTKMAIDSVDVTIDEEIVAAKNALVALASSEPEKWWTAFELKVRARNGWSSAVMGLALRELVSDGVLEQGSGLRVRIRP
jgi:RNA:NAD 2'-phosphotransferase (TPT1/KptA family)